MNVNVFCSAIFVLSTAFANVMQKKAVASLGDVHRISWSVIVQLLATPYMWAGMAAYVLSLTMYLVLLSRVPLNIATSIAALNFIAVLVASRIFLGEAIPVLRYVGFACILLGLYIVTWTTRHV